MEDFVSFLVCGENPARDMAGGVLPTLSPNHKSYGSLLGWISFEGKQRKSSHKALSGKFYISIF